MTYPSLLSHRSNGFKNLNGIKNWFDVAPEESLKTRATAGIAREPAPHALIGAVHAHLFPGITWSGIQKWFYFRKMLDCLLLTWRADAEGGKVCPGTRYPFLCYYTGLCTADTSGFFCFLSYLGTTSPIYNADQGFSRRYTSPHTDGQPALLHSTTE